MNKITPNTNGFQKSDENKMIERINRLRKRFDTVSSGDQETILKMLNEEIKHTENDAIKHWLMHFRDILLQINRGAFEPLTVGGATNV